jgi:hypothetical protein
MVPRRSYWLGPLGIFVSALGDATKEAGEEAERAEENAADDDCCRDHWAHSDDRRHPESYLDWSRKRNGYHCPVGRPTTRIHCATGDLI